MKRDTEWVLLTLGAMSGQQRAAALRLIQQRFGSSRKPPPARDVPPHPLFEEMPPEARQVQSVMGIWDGSRIVGVNK